MDTLDIPHRAALTTTTRLLSSLVTESLTRAIYLPISVNRLDVVALAVVLAAQASEKNPQNIAAYTASDVLAIAPLSHVPVFKPDGADARGGEIGILDPMDMYPAVFVVDVDAPDRGVHGEEHAELAAAIADSLSGPGWCIPRSATFRAISDPVQVWVDYADGLDLANELRADVADELASSVRWQSYSYHNPPRAPILADPSIVWEQSIVEGHPFYPMHKMRRFVPPIRNFAPGEYDLYNPKIRLVAVPRENLHITGEFEAQTRPIIDCAAKNAGEEFIVPKGHVLVPVHELQVQHIQDKFSDAKILPPQFAVLARAQQSIRSLILPSALTGTSLKLGVGIKLTSAVRTISPASAYLGPRFSAQVVPALKIDPAILRVAKELASVVHTNPDGEIAKHCAAIVRECHENGSEGRGERLIVCTSLVEYGHTGSEPGVPTVIRAFGLDTEEKRVQWLEEFVRMFFAAFFPPMLANGVGFEAYPQNTLARYSLASPPRLLGFVIRDFGGIRVHIETLRASTGVELDVVPGHSIIADSMDDVFTRMYHTAIHNHLQRLIRVLNLHYNGKGWDVVRKCFHEQVPAGHPFERAWLGAESKTVLGKCLMRMRLVGAYRHHLHGPHPNLLHYFGTEEEERRVATRGSSWEEIRAAKSQSE